jgi:hypothetical protein
MKMEATCSSETAVYLQLTTWCYIKDDRIVHFLCHFTSHCIDVYLLQKQICHYTDRYGHFVVKVNTLATAVDKRLFI